MQEELSDQERILAVDIIETRQKIVNLQQHLSNMLMSCQHKKTRITKYGSTYCRICDEDLGWSCPTSPTKVCEYSDISEFCNHCGQPSERK